MSKNSTANKNVYGEIVDEEKARQFELTPHLVGLMWEEPFYSRIIRSLNKKESTTIETAGVLADDGVFNFWWNRNFLASLTKNQVKGLLKHECLHLVYKHTTSRRKEPHLIWNWAADLSINTQIPSKELPKGGLVPGKLLPKLSPEAKSNMSSQDIANHEEISKLISSLPANRTSEFYFYELMKNETLKEIAKDKDIFNLTFGEGMDSHDGWDELSDDEREMLAEKLKEILKSACNEANEKGWGSISRSLRKQINKFVSRQVSWKSVLKRFCGFSNRQERENSSTRLNRKYPLIHPGSRNDYVSTIAVYIDESGSVSDQYLEKFYGELTSLSQTSDFWLYRFDTAVNESEGFLWRKGKKVNLSRTNCGGTCFNAPTEHANKNKDKFDGYIIFTDGIAPKPKSSRLKRGWLLTPDGSLNFKVQKSDIVINLK